MINTDHLRVKCKGTFYGPSGPSATALGGQNILTVRTHLKTFSGEKSNAINMDSCRRFKETFESTQRWKVKQMHVILHLFRQAIWDRIWKLTVERSQTNAFDVTLHLLRPAIWKYHHYNTNSGEKPLMKTHFNCDWCGKYIISDSALREHIERYIQERSPFNILEL